MATTIELIRLALAKVGYPEAKLVVASESRSQPYNLKQLEKNRIDIVWSMTSETREKDFLPVRIPILKGSLGYRICIRHKDNGRKFSKVKTLESLQQSKISIGQGHDWPDLGILQANGLRTLAFQQYRGIFQALKAKRFDCFARGINEIWSEIESLGDKLLVADEVFALYYYSPSFFFVNRGNTKLAEQLTAGLKAAIADGSFDKLFRRHWQDSIDKASLDNRHIIRLINDTLSPETIALRQQPNYWIRREPLETPIDAP